jgi:hypothetical protein
MKKPGLDSRHRDKGWRDSAKAQRHAQQKSIETHPSIFTQYDAWPNEEEDGQNQ